jgi:DHA2 family multidrug resistance protein
MITNAAMTRTEERSRIRNTEPSKDKPKQVSGIRKRVILVALGAGLVIGPVIGGYYSDNFGWKSTVFINVLFGGAMFAMLRFSLESEPLTFDLLRRGYWAGIATTIAIGLGALETVLEEGEWDEWLGSDLIVRLTIVVLGIVALTAFVIVKLVRKQQLLSLWLLARRNFSPGTLGNILLGLSLYGWIYFVPLSIAAISMAAARNRSAA